MHDNQSRIDLTERRVAEIGQLCLALAPRLHERKSSVAAWVLVRNVQEMANRLRTELLQLKDPDILELEMIRSLRFLEDHLRQLRDGELTPQRAAREIQETGERFYDNRFALGYPPRDLVGVAEELLKLRKQVLSYGTAHDLVISYASWIEAAISDWFNPDQDAIPAEVFQTIRERALAIMGFLDGIAYDGQQQTCAYLEEAAAFLVAQVPSQETSEIKRAGDHHERPATRGESKKPDTRTKDRFVFKPGQILFDGKDLELPSGEPINVLKRLVDSFGEVVAYGELDPHYSSATPGSLPKSVSTIRAALREHQVPCEVKSRRAEGYLLREIQFPKCRKKRERKR